MSYVYIKLNAFGKDSTDLNTDTIPLKVTSVSVSVNRQVLDFTVPLSSLATGESLTVGADFGAADKTISLQGFITDVSLTKSHTSGALTFTAQEVAQMIAASVDSSSLAKYQNFNELVILIPSNIYSNYITRGTLGTLVPLTFSARGEANTNTRPSLFRFFNSSSTDNKNISDSVTKHEEEDDINLMKMKINKENKKKS